MNKKRTKKKLASPAEGNVTDLYEKDSSMRDAVKTLRSNIHFSSIDKEIQTLVMTSTVPNEGKSLLSIFLGISMTEYGKRTLLVECDCRRPMLRSYLNQRTTYSVTDLLSYEELPLHDVVTKTSIPNLDFLNNIRLANPVEVLGSNKFWDIITHLKQYYHFIILDTPPLGSFIEAAVLGAKADGTVMVFTPGSTDIVDAQKAIAQLEKAKAHVLGAVLNNVDMSHENYYSDYYYREGSRRRRRGKKSFAAPDEKIPRAPIEHVSAATEGAPEEEKKEDS